MTWWVTADSSFAALELLEAIRPQVAVVTRLRLDAALQAPVHYPEGKFDTHALLCTRLAVTPLQVLAWFVLRWPVAVTCEEARAHLGMETQRQWATKAVARTTPCVLGRYALITLLVARVYEQQALTGRHEAWYAKECVTFSHTLAMVQRWLWADQHFQMSKTGAEYD